jgi:ClpX C4-type zinc finger
VQAGGLQSPRLPKDSGHLRAKVAFRTGFPETLEEGSIPGVPPGPALFRLVVHRRGTWTAHEKAAWRFTRFLGRFPGGRQVAVDRVLPTVFICDECIGLCGEILAEGATEPEVREELAEAAESLVLEVIDLLHAPPPGYAEMPRDLGCLVSQPLGAVKEALAELRADRPYPASTREPTTKESLDAAHLRAWELIDAHRVARRQNPPRT